MNKLFKIICVVLVLFLIVGCSFSKVEFTYSVDGRVVEIGDAITIKVLREDEIDYEYVTIDKENDIEIGDYITITYDKITDGVFENYEYEIKEVAEFSGMIESIDGDSAIILVDENESYISSSGDRVVVNIDDNKDLVVGDYVMVEYSGEIMESYPLQVNVIGIYKLMVN